jgi:predicted dehydrogenase
MSYDVTSGCGSISYAFQHWKRQRQQRSKPVGPLLDTGCHAH